MAHRKWKEAKQLPGTAGPGNILGCCLISFHLLWAIHPIRPVLNFYQICMLSVDFFCLFTWKLVSLHVSSLAPFFLEHLTIIFFMLVLVVLTLLRFPDWTTRTGRRSWPFTPKRYGRSEDFYLLGLVDLVDLVGLGSGLSRGRWSLGGQWHKVTIFGQQGGARRMRSSRPSRDTF